MKELRNDIAIGSLFITGLWGFISGAFIVSTVMFGGAAMLSNIVLRKQFD